MNSSNPDLNAARRALDKAQAVYQKAMLLPEVRATKTPDEMAEWHAAYYSSSTLNAFQDRFLKFQRLNPTLAAPVQSAYDMVCAAWRAYEVARLAEKARLNAKRAERAGKAKVKADLNLQEGVSLKGVDVGQYKVILAGLEPVRLHVLAQVKAALRKQMAAYVDLLFAAGWDPKKVTQWYTGRSYGMKPNYFEYPENFIRYFTNANTPVGIWKRRSDSSPGDWIGEEAERRALAYVQGYAAKLSMKFGEQIALDPLKPVVVVTSASVSTTNLWSDSVAELKYETSAGNRFSMRFHTQMIWNRSCLGKDFNQWPTRRVV